VMWKGTDLFSTALTIFRENWPYTTSKDTERGHTARAENFGGFLAAWIMTTGIQCNVEDAEETMRSLAYSTIEDDQKRFTQLVCFRRDLGRCVDDLKRSRSFVANCAKLPPPIANLVRRSAFGFESSRDPEEKPLDDTQVEMSRGLEPSEMSLEHRQAELERRLDAIKVDLNEEIQVAVGTVQVRDAQVMKEQATVTARQTTWTVALTVLAAIYLPMTLVTGIFGMNITEISSEATAPNAWWAVGAWVMIVILTVTGISVYVVVQKLRSRKKKSDLEANDNNGVGIAEAKQNACGRFGERALRWIRNARREAKAKWSRKRE
jgi:hypothetical protein